MVTEGFAPVPGGRLFFERVGSGNPVVWLHGGFLDRRMWDGAFARAALPRRYDLVRYDQRGYGRSDPPTGEYTEAVDLAHLLDHLGLGSAYLVGAAMGGRVALDFAAVYSARVDGLALVSPGLEGYVPTGGEEEAAWTELYEREDAIGALAARSIPEAITAKLALYAPRVDPSMRAWLSKIVEENQVRALGPASPHRRPVRPPAIERLAGFLSPTLVMTGSEELPAIAAIADRLANTLPTVQRSVVEGGDHLLPLSRPEEFFDLLEGFFARLDFIQMQRGSTH